MRCGKAVRPWLSSRRVLLVVALGALLSACAEVLPSPAPRPEVLSSGLGATRREWEHDHKVHGPFARDVDYMRLKGLVYEGGYRVTYWVDGPQEVAPSYARISRIELDTGERDPEALRKLARALLPDDAVQSDFFNSIVVPGNFTETFECPSLGRAYGPLANFTDSVGYAHWTRATVRYSATTPNIIIHMDVWGGIPPERLPMAVPTLPAQLTPPVPSL